MPEIIAPGGFQADRFEESRAKFVQLWRDNHGPNANTASDTPDGHIIDWGTAMAQAVIAEQVASYQSQFITTVLNVNGAAQILAPMFGTFPKQATGSTGQILAFGVVGTLIGAGSVCSTSQGGDRFTTDGSLLIEQSIWLAFTFGPAVIGTQTEIVIGPTTYGPSFGIVGTGLEVAQTAFATLTLDAQVAEVFDPYEDANGLGVLIVETHGILSATVSTTNSDSEFWRGSLMPVTSEELAPITAERLTLTRVDTPAPDDAWKGCANLASVTLGSNPDTLAQYVQRHLDTLGKNGSSSLVGLIGRLRDVEQNPGIEYVEIYNNTGQTTDAGGRPPHTFVEIIWENHPLGIRSFGQDQYIVVDPRTSKQHSVFLTDATEQFIWVDITIVPGEGFPTTETADLQVDVANRVVAFGQTRGVGLDAYVKDISAATGLVGIESCVVAMQVRSSPSESKPTLSPSNLAVVDTAILRWDTVRIEVIISE